MNAGSILRASLLTAAIAIAHLALGALSSITAIQPWGIGLAWLPAGLAAGVMLGWGWRCAPGIFLGACATRVVVFGDALGALTLATSLYPVIGAGVVVWLNERRLGVGVRAPGMVAAPLQGGALPAFVGTLLAGAVVNAALGAVTLCIAIPGAPGQCSSLFAAWLAGDVLGMMLVAPLVLRGAEVLQQRSGFGDWLQPAALSLAALGIVNFVLHESVERSSITFTLVSGAGLQSYISFGVLVASWTAAALLLWQAHTQRVHEQTRSENELAERRTHERFRDLAQLGADWMWETDAEGRYVWFTGQREFPWGSSTQALIGRRRLEVLAEWHDFAADPWPRHLAAIERHEPFANFVYRRETPDGRVFWLRTSGTPRYENGEFAGYRAVVSDITAEVESRERIKQLENRFAAVIANGAAVLYSCAAGGDFGATYVSENIRAQTGYKPEQLTDDPRFWCDRIHPDDVQRVLTGLSALFEQGRHVHEYRFRCASGEYRWMRDELFLVRDGAGRPLEITGVWINIEARKQMESALQRSEQRYRSVFDHATQAMFVVRDGVIQLRNPYAEQHLGPAVLARLAREVPVQDPGATPGDLQTYRLAEAGMPERWVQAHAVAIDWDEGPASLVFAADVTRRRQEEEQLRQSQKLEAIGQLTGGLAHDFNNLLGIVVGNLDLMSTQLPDDARVRARHDAALKAALRGAEVTNSLLAVARRQPLEAETHDVNALLGEIEPLLRASVGSAVDLRLELSGERLYARLDAAGLSNAVLNLVINARDALAGRENSRVVAVRTRLQEAPGRESLRLTPGQYVVLEVADNGPGMSPAILAQAFEPFFTTKQRGQGTGLGLSMVHGYAEQLGGTAIIESTEGAGTTVRVYLPLQSADGSAAPPPASPASELEQAPQAMRVLVVDDEAGLCEVACEWLESLGYGVTGVHGPAQALEALRAGRYDVLFSDVVMPGAMDGLALARECIRLQPGIRVLLTSGYAQSLLEASDLPGTVLAKPYRKKDLARALKQVCEEPL